MDVSAFLRSLTFGPAINQRSFTPEEIVCRRFDYLFAVGPVNARIKLTEDAVRRSLVHAQAFVDGLRVTNALESIARGAVPTGSCVRLLLSLMEIHARVYVAVCLCA